MRRIYHKLGLILALAAVPAGFAYAPSGWRLEGLRYWPRVGLLLCLASALACLVLLREKTPPAAPWAAAALALVCAVPALRDVRALIAPEYLPFSLEYLRRTALILAAAWELRQGRACLSCGCGAGLMMIISAACFLYAAVWRFDLALTPMLLGAMFAFPAYMIYRQLDPKE